MLGAAIPCSRAARFGVSPIMPRSCASPAPTRSPTTTSPVAMPTRTCRTTRRLERCEPRDQVQSSPYRAFCIILVRLRIAEIGEHAVAHIFCHEPVEATHRLRDALLVGGNDLAQILGIHARRECRRADQVDEHHGDLTALGGVRGLRLHEAADDFGCGLRRAGELGDGCEDFPPMPERNVRYPSGLDRSDAAVRRRRFHCRQNAARIVRDLVAQASWRSPAHGLPIHRPRKLSLGGIDIYPFCEPMVAGICRQSVMSSA